MRDIKVERDKFLDLGAVEAAVTPTAPIQHFLTVVCLAI